MSRKIGPDSTRKCGYFLLSGRRPGPSRRVSVQIGPLEKRRSYCRGSEGAFASRKKKNRIDIAILGSFICSPKGTTKKHRSGRPAFLLRVLAVNQRVKQVIQIAQRPEKRLRNKEGDESGGSKSF